MADSEFAIPQGLTQKGRQAGLLITKFLREKGLLDSGGNTVFHHPSDWRDESVPQDPSAILIVCHNCGRHVPAFVGGSDLKTDLEEILDRIGCYFGGGPDWYTVVHEG